MAGPRSFRYDIFLSHSSADKPAVRELAERLRAAGLRVWLDEWIIRPGDHISTAIDEGLEHSAVLLLCMSAQAFGSEWVSLEGYSAIFRDPLNRDRRFLPLRLDDAPIKAMLQGYAWIDWRPGADREAEWARLLAACRPEDLDRPDRADPAAGPGAEVETCADSTAELATPAAQDRQEGHRMAQLRALNLLHPGPVLSVTWSADGQRLASGGSDGTVRVWEAASGRELAVLEGHKGLVRSVSWSSDGQLLASGGEEGTVRLWDAASGCELAVLEGHKEPVMSVAWSADGQRLASGGSDGTVRLWDKASGRELAVLEGHKGPVRSVGWSADGKRLASCGSDGTVRLWKAASGQHLAVLNAHQGRVSSVGWSADGQRLVSGGDDGTVRLWMAVSGQHLAVLEGHQGRVSSVGWSADGQRLVSGGDDGAVRLWMAASGQPLAVLEGHQGRVSSVGWSADGQQLASGGADGTVRLWDVVCGRQLAVLEGHQGPVRSVGWNADGQRLASGGADGTVSVWEAASGRQLAVLEGHKGPVLTVGWSADGQRLASGGAYGTVRLWDVVSSRHLAVLKGHQGPVRSVGWSADGQRLATGGSDGTVRLWETASGRELAVLEGHQDWVRSVSWSPDGQRLASGGADGTVRLWDVASGRELAVLEGHKSWVRSVGWSADGQRLASGGKDATVRVWDAASGRQLAVLEGHKDWVNSVGWSPDGHCLASGGLDGTVRVWDAASGSELAVLEGHQGRVSSVGWSRDPGGLWSADSSGLVLLWQIESAQRQSLPASDEALTYTNAKVLVVGDSGAGKTGLTRRLATGTFEESDGSTVGAWCSHWPLPQAAAADEPEREIWLWDFGGQADQRLIHQLFLDRAALVLLLFDADREEVLEGLRDWQTALLRSLPEPVPQLLVAARVDAGFRASRSRLQRFAAEQGMALLETSAKQGDGCEQLRAAIAAAIPWEQLTRRTSPRLFRWIKAEILRLRDQGEVLLTYKDLRERLRQRLLAGESADESSALTGLPPSALDDPTLTTVLGLLDGPGVLRQLEYGSYVLLKPEWLSVYGQAVVRSLRQAEPQLGALPVGAIAAGQLALQDERLKDGVEEQVLLAELERQLQERRICLRQGGQLVFPSHCGRERPANPALPEPFVSYAVRGWLDEIHATLVVSLAETRVFNLQELWRDAAAFRTPASPRAMALQLRRDNASEGVVTLHMAPGVSAAERVQFAQLVDHHLRQSAEQVERRRHWSCPYCHAPKGNETVLMGRLKRDGTKARVSCDACDRSFPLWDNLEQLFAEPTLRQTVEALSREQVPQLTSRRKGKLLVLEVGARLSSANQKWLEIPGDEDDGLDLQLEFTDDNGIGTGRYLYLQLKAGPSHLRRRADGQEIFRIQNPRWIHTWTQQPGPVMLVIGRPAGPDPDLALLGDLGLDPELDPDPETDGPGWDRLGPFETLQGFGSSLGQRRFRSAGDPRFPFSASSPDQRAFPDVRWMEISSVLQAELDAGRRPEQIKQIPFNGEQLDLASVLRWRRRILDAAAPPGQP